MRESELIWQQFAALPGAAVDDVVGIASEQAIGGLSALIRKRRPSRILELGAGIGTLTFTILRTATSLGIDKRSDFIFYTIENNDYCLSQLDVNLRDFAGLYRVLRSSNELPRMQFDLIVVDGGGNLDNDMGVMNFDNMMSRGGAIMVEGGRAFQRDLIGSWYGHRRFLYGKFVALSPVVTARLSDRKVKNKPYHLFLFEPTVLDRLLVRVKMFGNRYISKIYRRLSRALASSATTGIY